MKVKNTITIYPNMLQVQMLSGFISEQKRDDLIHRRDNKVDLTEQQAIEILQYLDDNDNQLRPLIQAAGENVFGW